MRIEMRAQPPVPGRDPKESALYLIDSAEVSEEEFALAVRRRNEQPYSGAEWLMNGRPVDPELFARWRGL